MKHLKASKFNWLLVIALVFGATTVVAQKQTKTKKESFKVNKDVTIDINTSYTDIEFDTWNKDEVLIEATLEIEGATKEEAEEYFEKWKLELLGNSEKVTIVSKGGWGGITDNSFAIYGLDALPFTNLDFLDVVIPDIDFNLQPLVLSLQDLPTFPGLPSENFNFKFNYKAYEEDGDEYLEKWRKEFKEHFDGDFKEKLEAWKKELEIWKKEYKEEQEELKKELSKEKAEQREERQRILKEAKEALKEARESQKEVQKELQAIQKNGSNIFYFSSDGEEKKFKVKRSIKIKMPKDAKLKMNVRHGEVKLAENSKNVKATLSHTSLLAQNIDGENTQIEASYAPVIVENWNYGQLKTNFVKDVVLKNVKSLKLISNSSDVVLEKLLGDGIISGSFGQLEISAITDSFTSLDINLENTDALLVLPKIAAFNVYCNGSNSKLNYPSSLVVKKTNNYSNELIKGYYKQKNTDKSINISANYSDVVMQQ